jgi:hypothetical protein
VGTSGILECKFLSKNGRRAKHFNPSEVVQVIERKVPVHPKKAEMVTQSSNQFPVFAATSFNAELSHSL